MKVRVGQILVYHANLLDTIDGRTGLKNGDLVRVINMHGCPPANTMGHCYVGDVKTNRLIGLVHCNSLHTREDYAEYLRAKIRAIEEKR